MAEQTVRKTWCEFWGELLFRRYHQDDRRHRATRANRAAWLFAALDLAPGTQVLDLGCGDGLLDLFLARLGAQVTGVDRLAAVVAQARAEARDDGLQAEFEVADLRQAEFAPGTFDVVLIMDVLGLMSKADDADLLRRAARWLKPGGRLLMDGPRGGDEASDGLTRTVLADGVLEIRTRYDPETRLSSIVPALHTQSGQAIELYDPYDPDKPDHLGVLRCLYPPDELRAMLTGCGLALSEREHFWGPGYSLFIGRRSGDAA